MSVLPIDSPLVLTLAHLVSGQTSPSSVPDEQWPALIDLALDHGVGGMLLWSLRRAGWSNHPDSLLQPLVEWARASSRRTLLFEKACRGISAGFDKAEIPYIYLKGLVLGYKYYPEPHLRPSADIDILIPDTRLQAAREILQRQGFKAAEIDFFELGKFTDAARHHESFLDQAHRVKIELHFRLLVPSVYYQLGAEDADWFWSQVDDLFIAGNTFRAFKPEANLLYLSAHMMLQHQGEPLDLMHLLDMHLLISQSTLDWGLVTKRAVELQWTYALEWSLALLPGLFGTNIPGEILINLQQSRSFTEHVPQGWDPLLYTRRWDEWRSAYSNMTSPQRIRLIWRTLFPPQGFMRRQYRLSPGQSLFPYYCRHFLDGSREVVHALIGQRGAARQ